MVPLSMQPANSPMPTCEMKLHSSTSAVLFLFYWCWIWLTCPASYPQPLAQTGCINHCNAPTGSVSPAFNTTVGIDHWKHLCGHSLSNPGPMVPIQHFQCLPGWTPLGPPTEVPGYIPSPSTSPCPEPTQRWVMSWPWQWLLLHLRYLLLHPN